VEIVKKANKKTLIVIVLSLWLLVACGISYFSQVVHVKVLMMVSILASLLIIVNALEWKQSISDAKKDLVIMGENAKRANRWDTAMKFYKEALKIDPDSFDARVGLGFCLQAKSRFTEAIKQYNRALVVKPDSPETHFALGECHLETYNLEEALEEFLRATQIDPHLFKAYLKLGDTYRFLHKSEEAFKAYDQFLELCVKEEQRKEVMVKMLDLGITVDMGNSMIEKYQAELEKYQLTFESGARLNN